MREELEAGELEWGGERGVRREKSDGRRNKN